jgi:hypothetical protein
MTRKPRIPVSRTSVADRLVAGATPAQALSDLGRARQRAQDALLRVRLEGRSPRAVALAEQRAQQAADDLLAARLALEVKDPFSNRPRQRTRRG